MRTTTYFEHSLLARLMGWKWSAPGAPGWRWGRDYADSAPLKGSYSGGEASALEVMVDITRLA